MDRKRVSGPDKTVVPLLESAATALPTVFDPDRRKDERTPEQLRPMFMKTGAVRQANGSAYLETGRLKVTCGVYGPRQTSRSKMSTRGTLNCEFKFAPFSCAKRRSYLKDNQEREYSLTLQQALSPAVRLDLLPKSTVDVYVQVLECDGSTSALAAAITCASLALADAGIEMLDIVAACSAGFIGSRTFLDADGEEEGQQTGSLLLSYMPSLNEVTHIIQSGEVSSNATVKALEICVDACSVINTVMQKSLVTSIE
ncbi:ribosomal protein S5 domain 2-type protein [Blyttiomyces helicus]|uniref:Ribosomal protein S5 domain 2-type protein n=1 Tax=Blyttiomyces helicus TaxID=388810 RepID=A0A4P9WHQ1_9FUNG|nr:ribosomal protein S5 domain 2-type protein [Blyttiomyces helicus]|eukprot:RKO91485.1 ribosomal protein S5 domain 2-type protein [Blyttiomyces helicus]